MQIVIAWTTETIEIVQTRRTDLGELPITRPALEAHACTWLLDGDETDLKRAQTYAEVRGYQVYTFPVDHETSLDDARKRARSSAKLSC